MVGLELAEQTEHDLCAKCGLGVQEEAPASNTLVTHQCQLRKVILRSVVVVGCEAVY